MASPPPRIKALLLLDGYSRCQQGAQIHYKSALWNLNKARRQKARESLAAGSITAEDVREELRARAVLLEKTPNLSEEGVKSDDSNEDGDDQWTLVDAVKEISAKKENLYAPIVVIAPSEATQGLRNRKNTNIADNQKGCGLKEEVQPEEDDRLRTADPLSFFGAFPARDLKEAQKEAKAMLEAYVKAANLVAAIIGLTNQLEKIDIQ
jgi:hypothetical protein